MQIIYKKWRNQKSFLIFTFIFVASVIGGCATNHDLRVVNPNPSIVYIGSKIPKDSYILIARNKGECFLIYKKWHFLGTFQNEENLWAATNGSIIRKSCQKTKEK